MRSFFAFIILMISLTISAQKIEPHPSYKKIVNADKSLGFETAAKITGYSGLGLFGTGLILFMSEFGSSWNGNDYNENTANTGEALMYVGGALVAVTIPLWLLSKKHEKLSWKVTLNNKEKHFIFYDDRQATIGIHYRIK